VTKNLSADFSRRIFLEGRAPARPQISARQEPCPPIFRRTNSALRKIRQIPCPLLLVPHWLKPVAWTGQLNNFSHTALDTPHTLAFMHAYTSASLHACTHIG